MPAFAVSCVGSRCHIKGLRPIFLRRKVAKLVVALCVIRRIHTMTLWTAKDILHVCAGWKRQNQPDDNAAKTDGAPHSTASLAD
jgi:hypothetical protein